MDCLVLSFNDDKYYVDRVSFCHELKVMILSYMRLKNMAFLNLPKSIHQVGDDELWKMICQAIKISNKT